MHSICLLNGNGDTSIAVGQEMSGYPLKYFVWRHSTRPDPDRTVYCDTNIRHAEHDSVDNRIGILIEARELRPWNYDDAFRLRGLFKAIFTYDEEALRLGEPFLFYPLGGNYIRDWDMQPKNKMVSIIVGQKRGLSGWDMRHKVMETFGSRVDVYGYPNLVNPKTPAIRPYRFSIVIEACRQNYYFGEKLIDCLSQCTIPIYWGCPSIADFFDSNGLILFKEILDLEIILNSLSDSLYQSMLPHALENMELARRYRLPEDWLFENYPQLFGEL